MEIDLQQKQRQCKLLLNQEFCLFNIRNLLENQIYKIVQNLSESKVKMKKKFLIEKFITILILLRTHLRQVPLWAFGIIVVALYYAKYRKQGYTYTIAGFLMGTLLTFFGEMFQFKAIYLTGLAVIVIANFIPYTVYYIPVVKPFVGFAQDTLPSGLYVCQFYRLKEQPKPKAFFRKWASEKQFSLMYKNFIASMPALSFIKRPIFNILISYIQHYRIYFGVGEEIQGQELIIFSPGRGSTPFFYSNILMNLAKKRKVVSLQHNQQIQNPFKHNLKQAKKFRQEEVLKRALELVEVFNIYAQMPQYIRITLAGHSYGGATLYLAYDILKKGKFADKIQQLVMLDPWLFPLSDKMLKAQCSLPVLIIGNQFEVIQNDFHQINTKFTQMHPKTQYYCFRGADHLHQTDIPFVVGNNPFWNLKSPQKGLQMIQKNVKAVENFLRGKKVQDGLQQNDFMEKEWKVQKSQKINLFYL